MLSDLKLYPISRNGSAPLSPFFFVLLFVCRTCPKKRSILLFDSHPIMHAVKDESEFTQLLSARIQEEEHDVGFERFWGQRGCRRVPLRSMGLGYDFSPNHLGHPETLSGLPGRAMLPRLQRPCRALQPRTRPGLWVQGTQLRIQGLGFRV